MVARRTVFLDRDGVINVKQPEDVYVTRWEEFQFIPAIFDWIRLFNALDYLVIVVTNQRGIARGFMSNIDVEAIHTRMISELAKQHARIDDVYYCPHDKNACQCRKPAPGMVISAQAKWNIDLSQSLMIGDSDSDQQLAVNCGLRFLRAFEGRIV
jgi:D-glycero-D-manno-heptose 1,7-bisphosphate phosphatase